MFASAHSSIAVHITMFPLLGIEHSQQDCKKRS